MRRYTIDLHGFGRVIVLLVYFSRVWVDELPVRWASSMNEVVAVGVGFFDYTGARSSFRFIVYPEAIFVVLIVDSPKFLIRFAFVPVRPFVGDGISSVWMSLS